VRPSTRRLRMEPTDEGHRVTAFEVFFDLVFVFAFTRITASMAAELTPLALVRGLILLALMWWAWSAYTWLGNQARADAGPALVAGVAAMGAIVVVALVLPDAWHDAPGGLHEPLLLAVAYTAVRLLYVWTYRRAASGDRLLRRQLLRTSIPILVGCVPLLAGALIGGRIQVVLWAATFVIDFAGGRVLSSLGGYRVHSPGHFAERHRLVVIIALGESLAAVGTGIVGAPVSLRALTVALLGFALTVCLWLLYYRYIAPTAEQRLGDLDGPSRAWLARDTGTFLHFPLIAAIIYVALGVEQVLADGDRPLSWLALIALYGGAAVYLAALAAIRWRSGGATSAARRAGVAAPLVLLPIAHAIPAPAALAVLTALLTGLVLATPDQASRIPLAPRPIAG
jgi:low temperature requirement protein LtrA